MFWKRWVVASWCYVISKNTSEPQCCLLWGRGQTPKLYCKAVVAKNVFLED